MKKFLKEFKDFAVRGNVIDLAVGVVIGSAFTAIVNSLVNDIFMPLIGIITGGVDISSLVLTVGSGANAAVLSYGVFINNIVTFIIVAFCLFLFVKAINKLRRKKDAPPPAPTYICEFCREEVSEAATKCPHCSSQIVPLKK